MRYRAPQSGVLFISSITGAVLFSGNCFFIAIELSEDITFLNMIGSISRHVNQERDFVMKNVRCS